MSYPDGGSPPQHLEYDPFEHRFHMPGPMAEIVHALVNANSDGDGHVNALSSAIVEAQRRDPRFEATVSLDVSVLGLLRDTLQIIHVALPDDQVLAHSLGLIAQIESGEIPR